MPQFVRGEIFLKKKIMKFSVSAADKKGTLVKTGVVWIFFLSKKKKKKKFRKSVIRSCERRGGAGGWIGK